VEVALFNTIDSPGLGDTDGLSVSLSKELGQNLFLTAALSDSSTESALFDVESSAISLGAGLRGSFSESLDLFASASWFTTSTTVDNWGWGGGAGLDANTNGMEYVLGARFMAAEQLELYAQLETLLPNDETFFDETDSIAIGGLYHASESLAFRLGLTRSESRSGGEAELLMLGLFWFF